MPSSVHSRPSNSGRCQCFTATVGAGSTRSPHSAAPTSSFARSTARRSSSLLADEKVTFACMAPAVSAHDPRLPGQEIASTIHQRSRASPSPARPRPPPSSSASRRNSAGTSSRSTGLTETAPAAHVSRPRRQHRTRQTGHAASRAGVAGIGVDLKVLDDDGKPGREGRQGRG